ncbi:TPA: adenylate kinase family protein [Enterococcus faecium]|uniref:adenylate kinase family protein n=1 Tax=unclassified Enterococcus TaxID=2608891 RepID=UPI00280F6159|nr:MULTISPECIES: nucleoside monophosphate kinase [unclassified Enterococcus]MDQ8606112.1 nucleoside monophosphate kinase [Enterococcus sp. FR202]MDQ8648128.1 nucleoside monophosphate kinase [Enterococcus sp. FR208]MDQ8670919.1 nucleoside monophosphate kinase [Enterococcus sp. FR206]MDQ8676070.1 nucleoside monophosphate kinase [Enterococcus sp. FR210]
MLGKAPKLKKIAEKYHLTAISTGEMLREATKEKDTFGLRVQEYMNKGELVPDEWINSLVKSRLQAKDVENGFVLDGYPRTLQQAKMLEAYLESQNQNLDAVFFLDVSQDTLRHRLAQRGNLRSKEKQGNSQIESKREKIRLDDKLEVIENRLHINKELMESLIHFYKERNLLYVINGEGDFDNVFDNINEGLLSVNK